MSELMNMYYSGVPLTRSERALVLQELLRQKRYALERRANEKAHKEAEKEDLPF